MIKRYTFLLYILSFKVTNCCFSQLPIDNTTVRFICQVQRRKMPHKVYMTENEKLREIGMLEAWQSQNSIARHFGKSKSVISRLVSRYRQTDGVKIRDGRGRSEKTTPGQDRYLHIFVLRNRFISATELRDTFRGATGIRLSKSMIHNRLCGVGFKARHPFKGMHLTRAHKRLRNQRAQRHYNVILGCNSGIGNTRCSPMTHNSVSTSPMIEHVFGRGLGKGTARQQSSSTISMGVAVSFSGWASLTTKGRN